VRSDFLAKSVNGRILGSGGFGAWLAVMNACCAPLGSGLLEAHGGTQEFQQKAVRRLRPRGKLRLEQRGDKEAMTRQFDGTGLTLDAARAYAKSGRLELPFVFFVHAIVAVILLGVIFASANGMQASPWQDFQAFLTRGFRASLPAIGQSAGERSDHTVGRTGIVFRAVRVGNLQNISCIL